MLGNVYEWCLDEYDAKQAHEECFKGNPGGRVLRGGSFLRHPAYCRAAYRFNYPPAYSNSTGGFRVCAGADLSRTTTTTVSTPPTVASKEGGILAPAETRVAALTANPKVGEVCTLNLGGGVTMEMMGIPPGEFMMGSTPEERAWALQNGVKDQQYVRPEGEQPRRTRIKQGFWLGRTEVTVGQWKQFADATGYLTDGEKKGASRGPQGPGSVAWGPVKGANWKDPKLSYELKDNVNVAVNCISWDDAVAFCNWLNEREQKVGRLLLGLKLRLPTEAEWEYACRAGAQTKFWWGDAKEGGENRLNWVLSRRRSTSAPQVDYYGMLGRNQFGLADMLGNVREWCLDRFDPASAHEEAYTEASYGRVVRGGSGNNTRAPGNLRCASRGGSDPSLSHCDYGFRICVGPDVLASATATAAPVTRSSSPVTPAAPQPSTLDPQLAAFCREVAALPAEAQVQRVVAKLKELNPGFDGKETHTIENGQVTKLRFECTKVTDIAPVRALNDLKSLWCGGEAVHNPGLLADLSPLKGLRLSTLVCSSSKAGDLSPLRDMPLRVLNVNDTPVANLSPLEGVQLIAFYCARTKVVDLSPLRGMPIARMECHAPGVTDLSPLKGMPLMSLVCNFVRERDEEILRSIKTLVETINGLPVAEFWKRVEAGESPQAK
jgi:formylglycine-generating enzyme required for sulfatase activity